MINQLTTNIFHRHYTNFDKVNSDSTTKVWENRTFQSQGLVHILRDAEIHIVPQNMGKVNSHSTGKLWENTNIKKL